MTSEYVYLAMTFAVVTLAVRFLGPLMGRPRTPWRGAIIFGGVVALIGYLIGT